MMKKFLFIAVMLLSVNITNALGFIDDNGMTKTTILNVLKMSNNTYAIIEGNIVKRISDDKYQFRDNTGSITVEIDDDKWNGLTVGTKDKLELSGEIEKKFNNVIFDVDTVKKIPQ